MREVDKFYANCEEIDIAALQDQFADYDSRFAPDQPPAPALAAADDDIDLALLQDELA